MFNLCCIANDLKPQHKFMTMTWYQYTRMADAFTVLSARWLNNVKTTYHTIEHCHRNHWGYRVSSSLFPVSTHPDFAHQIQDATDYAQIQSWFDQIRYDNQQWGIRFSTHPDQFNVLASTNQQAVDKSIRELNQHGWLLDQLGCPRSYLCPINIHVNSSVGSASEIAQRFVTNLLRCDGSVTSRLVVENEDKGMWNVPMLLEHFGGYGIPITFDNLHHRCNPSIHERQAMEACAATWHGIKPIFHYSESDPCSPNPRAHATLPVARPPEFDCDWDVELKDKEQAIRMLA